MPDPSTLRDSTQIVLPREELCGLEAQLIDEFAVTVFEEDDAHVRIVGSPIAIKGASRFLSRHGVVLA